MCSVSVSYFSAIHAEGDYFFSCTGKTVMEMSHYDIDSEAYRIYNVC